MGAPHAPHKPTPQEELEQLEKAAVQHQKRQTFLSGLRAEVERLQGALAQHNLIIDAVVAKTPLEALQRDLEALTQANAAAAEALGALSEQRATAEAATRSLQEEADRLQAAMAEQLESLPEAVRCRVENALHASFQPTTNWSTTPACCPHAGTRCPRVHAGRGGCAAAAGGG